MRSGPAPAPSQDQEAQPRPSVRFAPHVEYVYTDHDDIPSSSSSAAHTDHALAKEGRQGSTRKTAMRTPERQQVAPAVTHYEP